jgi:hypothetical protein
MTRQRSEADQERLAAALRANLARRKAQSRQRQVGESRQGRPPEFEATRSTLSEGTAEPGEADEAVDGADQSPFLRDER